MNKQLEGLSVEQLKAKAYDLLVRIESMQQALRGINQEIMERQMSEPVVETNKKIKE